MFSDRFAGFVDSLDADGVHGWILDKDRAEHPVRVAIFCNGDLAGIATADQYRGDLESGGVGDGGHGFSFAFEPPIAPDRPTLIAALTVDTGETLPNGQAWLAPAKSAPALAPLLVTGAGRSGTTLLMSILARSPAISVAPGFPFERTLIAYYANAFRVLTGHADRDHHNDPIVTEDSYVIGPNPFFDGKWYWSGSGQLGIDYLSLLYGKAAGSLLGPFADIIQDYYRIVARETGKPDCIFFCEKNQSTEVCSREFARALHPGLKELVLSRDPRDLFMSQLNKFGPDEAETLVAVIRRCGQLVQIKRTATHAHHFIRYEDLVLKPDAELAKISAFLGVPIAMLPEREGRAQFAEHATSASPTASIGRWKTQLPDAIGAQIIAGCAEYMELFGYKP